MIRILNRNSGYEHMKSVICASVLISFVVYGIFLLYLYYVRCHPRRAASSVCD